MAGSLTPSQQADAAAQSANVVFGNGLPGFLAQGGAVASVNTADLLAAVQAIDAAFNTTLSAAVTAVGGSTTVYSGLAKAIPSPVSGLTAIQQTLIVCLVLLKRAGAI